MQFGRYELLEKLATGGMAEVFLARRTGPGGFAKTVAVKRILPHLSGSAAFVEMFLDEARIAALLDHPNITHVYDFGEVAGQYFLAMEYVAGEDLFAILHHPRFAARPFPLVAAATVLIGACSALHYAHELAGPDGRPLAIVHRDVTPSNILVTYDGAIKIADFGIAKAEIRAATTHAGALKGKHAYLCPEQIAGQSVDRRADVWSLGVCAWELFCGRRLFARSSELGMVRAVLEDPIPRPETVLAGLPPELGDILLRALARDPDERYPTAQAFQLALEGLLGAAGLSPSTIALGRALRGLFGAERADGRRRQARGAVRRGEATEPFGGLLALGARGAEQAASLGRAAAALVRGTPPGLGAIFARAGVSRLWPPVGGRTTSGTGPGAPAAHARRPRPSAELALGRQARILFAAVLTVIAALLSVLAPFSRRPRAGDTVAPPSEAFPIRPASAATRSRGRP